MAELDAEKLLKDLVVIPQTYQQRLRELYADAMYTDRSQQNLSSAVGSPEVHPALFQMLTPTADPGLIVAFEKLGFDSIYGGTVTTSIKEAMATVVAQSVLEDLAVDNLPSGLQVVKFDHNPQRVYKSSIAQLLDKYKLGWLTNDIHHMFGVTLAQSQYQK